MSPRCSRSRLPSMSRCIRLVVLREGQYCIASLEPSMSACPMSAMASSFTDASGPLRGGVTKEVSGLNPNSCAGRKAQHMASSLLMTLCAGLHGRQGIKTCGNFPRFAWAARLQGKDAWKWRYYQKALRPGRKLMRWRSSTCMISSCGNGTCEFLMVSSDAHWKVGHIRGKRGRKTRKRHQQARKKIVANLIRT